MIGNSRFHRGSDAQGLMNSAEIVIHEIECQRVLMIFQFLRKSVSEASKSPQIAATAAAVRWNIPKATYPGDIKIGDNSIPVAVLEDGTRVVTQRGVFVGLGRHRNPTVGQS